MEARRGLHHTHYNVPEEGVPHADDTVPVAAEEVHVLLHHLFCVYGQVGLVTPPLSSSSLPPPSFPPPSHLPSPLSPYRAHVRPHLSIVRTIRRRAKRLLHRSGLRRTGHPGGNQPLLLQAPRRRTTGTRRVLGRGGQKGEMAFALSVGLDFVEAGLLLVGCGRVGHGQLLFPEEGGVVLLEGGGGGGEGGRRGRAGSMQVAASANAAATAHRRHGCFFWEQKKT